MSDASDDERAQELECLESIYADKYSYDTRKNTFSVTLQAEEDEDDRSGRGKVEFGVGLLPNFGLTITFKQPENYPDVPIEYELEHEENIVEEEDEDDQKDAHIQKIKVPDPFWFGDFRKIIETTCEENLGSIMAFSVCSDLQDGLTKLCEDLHEERQERISTLQSGFGKGGDWKTGVLFIFVTFSNFFRFFLFFHFSFFSFFHSLIPPLPDTFLKPPVHAKKWKTLERNSWWVRRLH